MRQDSITFNGMTDMKMQEQIEKQTPIYTG